MKKRLGTCKFGNYMFVFRHEKEFNENLIYEYLFKDDYEGEIHFKSNIKNNSSKKYVLLINRIMFSIERFSDIYLIHMDIEYDLLDFNNNISDLLYTNNLYLKFNCDKNFRYNIYIDNHKI